MLQHNVNVISEDLYNQNSSWCFSRTLKLGDRKVRVMICRNAYDFQSYIRGFVWCENKSEWHQVDHMPMTKDKATYKVSYVDKNPDRNLFKLDCVEVLRRVEQVIF